MTKEKMETLYNKSSEYINMMTELGKDNYKNYKLKFSSQGTFLTLDDSYISSSLKNDYIDDNLSDFVPATTIEIMKQFEYDIDNNFFDELEKSYIYFNKKWNKKRLFQTIFETTFFYLN